MRLRLELHICGSSSVSQENSLKLENISIHHQYLEIRWIYTEMYLILLGNFHELWKTLVLTQISLDPTLLFKI